jgi:glycosidase
MHSLRNLLKYDALYPDPLKITTMVNNHDTPRFMSLPGATLEGAQLHMAFMLSVRGIPQLYYGEEIAMEGKEDPDNRRDFPGGFPDDPRNAFDSRGRNQTEQAMFEWTRRWLRLRAEHSAIRRGQLIDLFYDDEVYVFMRQDQREKVILAFNRSAPEKTVVMPAAAAGLIDGASLIPLLGDASRGSVAKGSLQITMPPRSASAFIVR